MRKVVIHRAGGYERLSLEEGQCPEPGPGELRIDVAAIGVNYADCVIRMGLYASARELVGWPITPGFEVAGVVSAVGPGVTWPIGQDVIAVTRFGGYASQVVVPASQVFLAPQGLSARCRSAWRGAPEARRRWRCRSVGGGSSQALSASQGAATGWARG